MSGSKVASLVLGLAAAIFGFFGARASLDMALLRSQAGNTVAEAFDNSMGAFALGLTGLSLVLVALLLVHIWGQDRQTAVARRQEYLLTVIVGAQGFDGSEDKASYISGALAQLAPDSKKP